MNQMKTARLLSIKQSRKINKLAFLWNVEIFYKIYKHDCLTNDTLKMMS